MVLSAIVIVMHVHLCMLFNALLAHSFVPSDFCKCIIVPLYISNCVKSPCSLFNRGITLSPVLSKLFEIVSLHLFESILVSDDLQFGFEKSSCSHMYNLHLMKPSDILQVVSQKFIQPF